MPNHYTVIGLGCGHWSDETGDPVFDVKAFNERDGWNLCDQVRPMPEEVKGDVPGLDPPWYVWANANWGTKWGTYGEKAQELDGDGMPILVTFKSAWGPPNDECLGLIQRWFAERGVSDMTFMGHDPYDGSISVLSPCPPVEADNAN
jgi:hypothetical protein